MSKLKFPMEPSGTIGEPIELNEEYKSVPQNNNGGNSGGNLEPRISSGS